jgi:phosphoribosylaminoimidazole-succinocarboxamide synthase
MKLEIPPRTWLALAALGPAVVVAVQLLPLLRAVFLVLLMTALLTLLISPLADRLERRGVSRGLTAALALGGAAAVLVGLLLLLLPALLGSLERLVAGIGPLTARAGEWLSAATGSAEVGAVAERLVGQAGELIRWATGQLGSTLAQVGVVGFGLFVTVTCVFALVSDRRAGRTLLETLVPARHHARAASLTEAVGEGLSRWFIAQLAICGYYVVAYTLTLWVLGVPYAVQIGVVSGLLEFIPYLGGLVGMVLSVLSAATVGPTTVVLVLAIEAVIGSACVYFVAPYAFSKAVEVPPALVLLGLFIGGLVGGFFAALLTVPLLAAGLVVYRQLRGRPAAPAEAPPVRVEPRPTGD